MTAAASERMLVLRTVVPVSSSATQLRGVLSAVIFSAGFEFVAGVALKLTSIFMSDLFVLSGLLAGLAAA